MKPKRLTFAGLQRCTSQFNDKFDAIEKTRFKSLVVKDQITYMKKRSSNKKLNSQHEKKALKKCIDFFF